MTDLATYMPSVLDIFCGAGGFSEGFRQQGFKIVMGVDRWQNAAQTFEHNFETQCIFKDVKDYYGSLNAIHNLPNTDIIIGSPPCVNFSHSNKSGKADKSLGISLIRSFFRIVAVKKHQKNSILKSWLMENVPNSIKYLKDSYTFEDLNLMDWARNNGFKPNMIAIDLKDRSTLINSADHGTPQSRHRVIISEIVEKDKPIQLDKILDPAEYITLGKIKNGLPVPNRFNFNDSVTDPLYPEIKLHLSELSDHFYDTGLYECEWRSSRFFKVNHPYMGKMSFPENEDRPSRTVTATFFKTSREALIYRSEYKRKGNGEYRIPTNREIACLMGFPITFQFHGSEGMKCKLIGNAVCPPVSSAYAKKLRLEMGLPPLKKRILTLHPKLEKVNDLKNNLEKEFNSPPIRTKRSRFRRHPFKDGNVTVTLSNYDIKTNGKEVNTWITSVQYGNGKGFPIFDYPDGFYKQLENIIREKYSKGNDFIETINNGFSEKIAQGKVLQKLYELQASENRFLEPTELIEELAELIKGLGIEKTDFMQNEQVIFKNKNVVPAKQLFALYAINKISTIANGGK